MRLSDSVKREIFVAFLVFLLVLGVIVFGLLTVAASGEEEQEEQEDPKLFTLTHLSQTGYIIACRYPPTESDGSSLCVLLVPEKMGLGTCRNIGTPEMTCAPKQADLST